MDVIFLVTLVMFLVTLVMFVVALVVFTDLVALTFSVPVKATLKEIASRIARHTIIPTLVEFFVYNPPNFSL
jgi:hypothetical protein